MYSFVILILLLTATINSYQFNTNERFERSIIAPQHVEQDKEKPLIEPNKGAPLLYAPENKGTLENVSQNSTNSSKDKPAVAVIPGNKLKTSEKASKNLTSNPNWGPKVIVKTENEESGILTRGMMVLLSISVVFIIFVAYKTYRRRNKRTAMVKKYGVRAPRSDIEMTPLPLDDEDDDDTIFDLKNIPK